MNRKINAGGWVLDASKLDKADRRTMDRIAAKNGVPVDEVAAYFTGLATGRLRRGSRRLDLGL